jgi:hypothetical protein
MMMSFDMKWLAGGLARDGLDVPWSNAEIGEFAVVQGRELSDRTVVTVPRGVTGFQCLKHDNVLLFRFSVPNLFRRFALFLSTSETYVHCNKKTNAKFAWL